jgi:AcrR family transcriptional regulator
MPESSGTDTGYDTRRRLLQAALRAFGRRDYDAVGTRQIVEAAGANISAISYHFGGKQGLYLATAEFLAESMRAELQADLKRIEQRIDQADSQQCRTMLGELIGGFVGNLLTGEFGEDAPGFILREQNQPTEAFDVLYAKLFGPMHGTMAALVAGARGLPAGSDEARMVAHALLGHALAFRGARTTMLRHLGRAAYTAQDLKQIQALIGAMTVAALGYSIGDQS